MKLFLTLAIATLLQGYCIALPEDPAEYLAWEKRQLSVIEAQKKLLPEQSIPTLGKFVYRLSLPTHQERGDRVVFNASRNLLLSIPNHAEWFGNEINRMTDIEVEGQFHHERGWYFTILSHLQSPQTVQVLGELLFDERDPWKNIPTDATWYPSSVLAVRALHNLGIEKPPVNSEFPDPRNDLLTWQLWYEQVRAGTRTFSFKGDKTTYSLTGPVATARDPGSVRPGARASPEPSSIDSGSSARARTPALIALGLAILALLLAAKRAFQKRIA
jgi:hypothetical protein